MNKLKVFFQNKRNILILLIAVTIIIAVPLIFILTGKNKPIETAQAPSSEHSSSEETSSILIKVPEIKVNTPLASSEVSSATSSKEVVVDKTTTSKPVVSSKPSTPAKPKLPVSSKPTAQPTNTPADGDFKTDGDKLLQYWKVDGKWHDVGSADGGEIVDLSDKQRICEKCGGITDKTQNTCTCPPVGK